MAKVLIIDNELDCKILQQQLSLYNYDVIVASEGGDQGILLSVLKAPDVILIGTELRVIDDLQTIKILKTSTVTQQIPVMTLISPTVKDTHRTTLIASCDDYCLKPVALNLLVERIRTLLQQSVDGHSKQIALNYKRVESRRSEINPRHSPPTAGQVRGHQDLQPSLNTVPNNGKNISTPPRETRRHVKPDSPMVVYIEDSQADSAAMSAIVQNAGYRYANIADSLHALPQLLAIKPQLIFLDLVMPVVNGYELCAQIQRISMFKTTPIVIVTNNDGITDRVRAKFLGASSFLGKPITKERTLKAITRYLKPVADDVSDQDYFSKILPSL